MPENKRRRVLIVTPCYNAGQYINETLNSVLSQANPKVDIHYHVQDGLSTDETMAKVRAFAREIGSRDTNGSIVVSYSSESDRGMYDAINRGFTALQPCDDDLLTWINADDLLVPGAVSTVLQTTNDILDCQFLSGRVALMNDHGSVTNVGHPIAYPQDTLAAGLHDGRNMPFIMQEGTFFTGWLWNAVGGVNTSFKLAGDWDLWRRMAKIASHHTIDSLLGLHRRHAGQLSHNLTYYHDEVDAHLPADGPSWIDPSRLFSHLLRFDIAAGRWVKTPFNTTSLPPPTRIGVRGAGHGQLLYHSEGFAPAEGPYPEYGLPSGVRWMEAPIARIVIAATIAGRYRCRIRLRAGSQASRVEVRIDNIRSFATQVPSPRPMKDEVIEFGCWLQDGHNDMMIEAISSGARARRLLIIDTEVLFDPPKLRIDTAASASPEPSRIIVRIDANGRAPAELASTLGSIALFGRNARCVVAGVAGNSLNESILRAFAHLIEAVVSPAEQPPQRGDPPESDYHIHLVAGERLAAGFHDIIDAAIATNADRITGLVEITDQNKSVSIRGLKNQPVLIRTGSQDTGISPVLSGSTISTRPAQKTMAKPKTRLAPRVWLLEKPGSGPCLSPIAAALALLGANICYSRLNNGNGEAAIAMASVNFDMVISNWNVDLSSHSLLIAIEQENGFSIIGGTSAITGPNACDRLIFSHKPKWLARRELGLSTSETVVVLDVPERGAGIAATLFGNGTFASVRPLQSMAAKYIGGEQRLLACWLQAADVVLVESVCIPTSNACVLAGRVALTLADLSALGALHVDQEESTLLKAAMAIQPAALVGCAFEDLAIRLWKQANLFPEFFAVWLASVDALVLGPIAIPTYDDNDTRTALCPDHLAGIARLIVADVRVLLLPDQMKSNQTKIGSGGAFLLETMVPLSAVRIVVKAHGGRNWAILGGSSPIETEHNPKSDRIELLLKRGFSAGLHRVEFRSEKGEGCVELLAWEPLGVDGQDGCGGTSASTYSTPLSRGVKNVLVRDGDWKYQRGQYAEEEARPELGLFQSFRWSKGKRSAIRFRADYPGQRGLRLAFTTVVPGMMVRVWSGNQVTTWSDAADGVIGRATYCKWTIEVAAGQYDLIVETSTSLGREDPRDLGVILLSVVVGPPVIAAIA